MRLTFHKKHHQLFGRFNDGTDSLYVPGTWIPHCTLANRLSVEKLKDAYLHCIQMKCGNLQGEINRLGLIKLEHPNSASFIFTMNLKKN